MKPDPLKHLHKALSKGMPKSIVPPAKPEPEAVKLPETEVDRNRKTCHRKSGYSSAQYARKVGDYKETLEPGLKLFTYKCHACGKWHLTSKDPSRWKGGEPIDPR